jgi:hypothetical protein
MAFEEYDGGKLTYTKPPPCIASTAAVVQPSPSPTPTITTPALAIVDAGASGHYLVPKDVGVLSDLQPTQEALTVRLANGTTLQAISEGFLSLPTIPHAACCTHVFPALHRSLLSVASLCDHGCVVEYDHNAVHVYCPSNSNSPILSGSRCPSTGLWLAEIGTRSNPSYESQAPSAVAEPSATAVNPIAPASPAPNLVAFYHAAMGSPSLRTLIAALGREYIQLPGLTSSLLRKYPPDTTSTEK